MKALSAMAGHAPVEAITTGGQKATSKLQERRSREKELDKLVARHVRRAKRNRFQKAFVLKPEVAGCGSGKFGGREK
jgi:hypothetical protein